ncbi:MAG TPA: C25 family cysteine peptidase, partial [Kiritimatiellia bacterium]|nr:C25 family cysteine peptidase [Kiritimatiellia bacterium]
GYQFVSVRVNPLAYIAAEKKLYLRETVTVTVTYDAPVAAKKILPKQKTAFEPLVNSLVVNPEAAADFAPALETRVPRAALDYLIITSGGLSNAFQQIADYRASAVGGGYTTRVMTTNDIGSAYSGADIQAKIRDCISNNVATLGTTMVLLGGDDTIVPVRGCKVSAAGDTELTMPTDLYYSGLGGSWDGDSDGTYGETSDSVDLAYDVVVGRLPMRTATQVTNYLNKVMTYEAGWNVTNKIMLGGPYAWDTWTGTARPSDDVTGDGHAGFRSTDPAHDSVSDSEAWLRRLYRDGIHDYWPAQVNIMCDTITSWDTSDCGSYLQSSANTASKFNQNYTHLMFSGHGAPQEWGLESGYFDDADASSQTGLTAFVYTDACLTGHFDKNSNNIDGYNYTTEPCLGEAFLRNTRVRGGALAYMGCARYGWGEPGSYDGGPSTVYAYKFYKRMYETTNRTIGLAFAMHKADMASLSSKDDCERWIQFGVNLLGDPALKMPRDVPVPSAPSFTSASSFGATTGVEKTHSVVASGYPTPVLSLQSSSASAGSYSFVASSGVLTYQPPAADEGTKTFTFVATNTQGSVTQIVSATVTLAPPAAPASIWASATNTTDFTAAWSSVADATGYRLDVSTNSNFAVSDGEGGGEMQLGESFDSGLGTSYETGNLTLTSGVWNGVAVIKETVETYGGTGAAARLNDDTPGACLRTPALDTVGSITFWYRELNSGGGNFILQKSYDASTWIGVHTQSFSGNTYVQYSNDVDDAASTVYLRVLSDNQAGHLIVDEFEITSYGSSTPDYVPGYSNRTVAGTSQSVTGLTAGATYYFRARAVNGGGSSPNTSVASVTTLATLSAPVFGANPGPVAATAGVDAEFTVSASGVPAPTLALDSTTAAVDSYDFDAGTGDLLYVAPQSDAGTKTFSFSAVNSQGSAYQTVTVNVAAATAPA